MNISSFLARDETDRCQQCRLLTTIHEAAESTLGWKGKEYHPFHSNKTKRSNFLIADDLSLWPN